MIRLWNSVGLWGRFGLVIVAMATIWQLVVRWIVRPLLGALAAWAVDQAKDALKGDEEEEENGGKDEDTDGGEKNGDEPDPDGLHGNGGGQLPFDSSLVFIGRAELEKDLERRPGRAMKR